MRKACSRCSVMSEGVITFRSRKGWVVNLCDDCLEELEERGIDLFGELERVGRKRRADED
jgi:coenzyme F420-reducing hydrogenase beta subunit